MTPSSFEERFDEGVVYKNAHRGTIDSPAFIKDTKDFIKSELDKRDGEWREKLGLLAEEMKNDGDCYVLHYGEKLSNLLRSKT
jgi:hypothetical protein